MERLLERCAALDVHQASVSACVRVPGEGDQRREFNERFGATAMTARWWPRRWRMRQYFARR